MRGIAMARYLLYDFASWSERQVGITEFFLKSLRSFRTISYRSNPLHSWRPGLE